MTSKSGIVQQKALVLAIKAEPSVIHSVKIVRTWLEENGYETVYECRHFTINRESGKCTSCGTDTTGMK